MTKDDVESHQLFVGALVSWLHVPRGGYGYGVHVDAKVVALNLQGNRARIEVAKKDGSTALRDVPVESLYWRKP